MDDLIPPTAITGQISMEPLISSTSWLGRKLNMKAAFTRSIGFSTLRLQPDGVVLETYGSICRGSFEEDFGAI